MSGYQVVTGTFNTPTVGAASDSGHADCPTGKKPVGGGADGNWKDSSGGLHLFDIATSSPDGNRWDVLILKANGDNWNSGDTFASNAQVYAVCVVAN